MGGGLLCLLGLGQLMVEGTFALERMHVESLFSTRPHHQPLMPSMKLRLPKCEAEEAQRLAQRERSLLQGAEALRRREVGFHFLFSPPPTGLRDHQSLRKCLKVCGGFCKAMRLSYLAITGHALGCLRQTATDSSPSVRQVGILWNSWPIVGDFVIMLPLQLYSIIQLYMAECAATITVTRPFSGSSEFRAGAAVCP